MFTVVIYDSSFGNTARIAQAIATGAIASGGVRVLSAAEAATEPLEPVDLLIVGGPTQRHHWSPGLEGFLQRLPRKSMRGLRAVTFDTRYRMSAFLTGSAAKDAAAGLRRAGCQLIAAPESFFMEKDAPPKGQKRRHELEQLEVGELERAQAWGRRVAAQVQA